MIFLMQMAISLVAMEMTHFLEVSLQPWMAVRAMTISVVAVIALSKAVLAMIRSLPDLAVEIRYLAVQVTIAICCLLLGRVNFKFRIQVASIA